MAPSAGGSIFKAIVGGAVSTSVTVNAADENGETPLLLACGNGGVSWAERTVPSGLAALLLASVPLWMVIADRALTKAVPSRLAIVALVVGFAGILVLSHPGGSHVPYTGIAVILVAAMCWAVGSVIGRKVTMP